MKKEYSREEIMAGMVKALECKKEKMIREIWRDISGTDEIPKFPPSRQPTDSDEYLLELDRDIALAVDCGLFTAEEIPAVRERVVEMDTADQALVDGPPRAIYTEEVLDKYRGFYNEPGPGFEDAQIFKVQNHYAFLPPKLRRLPIDMTLEDHPDTVAGAWWRFKRSLRVFLGDVVDGLSRLGETAIEKTTDFVEWCWKNWFPLMFLMGITCWVSCSDPAYAAEDVQAVQYHWPAPTSGTAVVHYEVEHLVNDGQWLSAGATPDTAAVWILEATLGDVHQIRVRGVDAAGTHGMWSIPSDPWLAVLLPGNPGQPYRIFIETPSKRVPSILQKKDEYWKSERTK